MATNIHSLPQALKSLECPLCLDQFRDPKMLIGCGHTFCDSCLKSVRNQNGKYACPQCRKFSKSAETNFAVKGILDSFRSNQQQVTNEEGIVGGKCCHTSFVSAQALTNCSHCDSKFCQSCLLNHKVFLRLEAEMIASIFNIQEESLKSNNFKLMAKRQLEAFCDDMKLLFTDVVEEFKEKIDNHIERVCRDVSKLGPALKDVDTKLTECKQVSEIFLPFSQLQTLHKDIVELDKRMARTKDSLKIPAINKSKKDDIDHIRLSMRSLLMKRCEPSLLVEVFVSRDKLPPQDEYVPSFFQTLQNATRSGDLETVKEVMESPKLPAKSIKYILNQVFPCDAIDLSDNYKTSCDHAELSNSLPLKICLLTLATIHNRADIARYLINLDGVDLLEKYSGKNVVQHLLGSKRVSRDMEKLIEELLQKEPKLINILDSNGTSIFQYALSSESVELCRFLVENCSVDINAHFVNGLTPLIAAIRLKSEEIFDALLSLGASLTVTASDGSHSCLHESFKMDWPHSVKIILAKHPEMLIWMDSASKPPMFYMAASDALASFMALEEWAKKDEMPVGAPGIHDVYRWASEENADKLGTYLLKNDYLPAFPFSHMSY